MSDQKDGGITWVNLVGMAFILAALIFLGVATGHCTPSGPHTNSLGVIMVQDNPYTYKEGAIKGGAVVQDDHHSAINLVIQPSHMYMLFSEQILLCADDPEKFANIPMSSPVVITYETVAHTTIAGVGCHELIGIDIVADKVAQ